MICVMRARTRAASAVARPSIGVRSCLRDSTRPCRREARPKHLNQRLDMRATPLRRAAVSHGFEERSGVNGGQERPRRRGGIDASHEPVITQPLEAVRKRGDERVKGQSLVPLHQPVATKVRVGKDVEQCWHERSEVLGEAFADSL